MYNDFCIQIASGYIAKFVQRTRAFVLTSSCHCNVIKYKYVLVIEDASGVPHIPLVCLRQE